jgi:cysteine-rich repeat protein
MTITLGWVCPKIAHDGKNTSNCSEVAGNSITTINEMCDDGNLINGDGCEANMTITKLYECEF